MDECLQVLAEKPESPADEVLVQHVKIQLVMETLTRAPWHEVESVDFDLAKALYLKALEQQLQELKTKIPPRLTQDGRLYRG